MIKVRQKGDFSKLTKYLNRINKPVDINKLDKYGRQGVAALKSATPVDTGKTANSWYYEINNQNGKISINFCNSNINKGVPIAIILQYGHSTRTGGWVQGIDYINPVIKPLFEKIANDAWKEVTKQ